jgi:hypothetical protein
MRLWGPSWCRYLSENVAFQPSLIPRARPADKGTGQVRQSMRLVLCLALLFSELGPISGQDTMASYCPQTARLSGRPADRWFEGTIGPKHVRMYVERGGQEVVGLYYDVADWKPILLGGHEGWDFL